MGWVSLGILDPTEDWQSYPIDAIDSQTFRVIQSDTDPLNSVLLAQLFPEPGGRALPMRRIFPSREAIIFTLPIPPEYQVLNPVFRTIQIRRRLPYYPSPWRIELQVLY